MIHFCIGSVLKCISLCKKRGKGVSDAYISNILFPMSEATGFIGHIKDCTKNLPYDVQRYMVSTDRESIEDGISTSVKEIINGILDTNRFKILVLALRDIIANDYSIDADTIIGFDAKYKKRTLAQQSMFLLPEFLTNVLVYVMSSGNNTVGRSSINNLNEAYLASFEEKQDSITITLLKNQENRGIRESWEKIDRINPFKYNSCTTELIGRENDLAALHRFLEQDENISVKWWAITGVGGSGKSRLAFEFACGLDKDVWHSEFITRDRPFVFEQLQMISDKDTRNLLLVIDNDSSDMEPLANWLSYIYDRKENRQIRVLICQRVKINEGENCMAPWRESLLDYNEIVGTLLYEDAKIGSAVDVPSLEDQSQKAISASYSKLVYKKNLWLSLLLSRAGEGYRQSQTFH